MEMRIVPPAHPHVATTGPVPTTSETAAIVGEVAITRREIASTGMKVFPLAMNAKRFGSEMSRDDSLGVLDAFADAGGNMVDTADSYGGGASERVIGEWLARRPDRDRLLVATKVGKSPEHPGLSARAIAAAVDGSLRRLRVERIDLLYLHLDDTDVAFEETLLAIDDLIRRGKVRSFGMSDHTGTRLLAARVACALLGVAPMSALQNEYSLMHRGSYEGDLARVAAQQGLAVMPRFPLAGGFLTGAYRTRALAAASPVARYVRPHLGRRGRRVLATLDRVAAEHDASLATVALAWLLTKPGVVAPVVSASYADQLFDLMSAPEVRLTRQQATELDRASA